MSVIFGIMKPRITEFYIPKTDDVITCINCKKTTFDVEKIYVSADHKHSSRRKDRLHKIECFHLTCVNCGKEQRIFE